MSAPTPASNRIARMQSQLNSAHLLIATWEANGNSRELGDPRAAVWHDAANQLRQALTGPARAEDVNRSGLYADLTPTEDENG